MFFFQEFQDSLKPFILTFLLFLVENYKIYVINENCVG